MKNKLKNEIKNKEIILIDNFDDKEIKKESNIDDKRKLYYVQFENQVGKKAIWNNKETRAFEIWYENLILKENESIKCIVRYFPDENSRICQDFQLKYKDLELDENNNIIWSLTPETKKHILNDIAYSILSIPVFHVVSSHKYSVKLKLNKGNDNLYDYGCNSFDQYNKLHSDVLTKNLKILIGKLYSKWTIYLVIFLFFFLITCLPFFPFVFPKYFVK